MSAKKFMMFTLAELGAVKSVVDSIQLSKNRTVQAKNARILLAFMSQINRVRNGKPLINVELYSISTEYQIADNETLYSFFYVDVPPKEKKKEEEEDLVRPASEFD